MPNYPGPLQGLTLVTEDGLEHPIMGGPIRFVYLDGAGMATVRRILEKSPTQHGAVDRGFRLEPREMTLRLVLDGKDTGHADTLRDQIAYYFGPTNSPLKLRAVRDDRTVRQIDCFVNGEVDFPQSDRLGAGHAITIPLLAPDPTFYYPTQQVSTKVLTNGTSTLDLTISGMTWDDWAVYDITGPLNAGFVVQHTPGDESIRFQTAIPAGETFRMTIQPNRKTVLRTSDSANRMSYVDPLYISGFSEFRILSEKATRATNGAFTTTNRFTFTAAGTTGASAFTVYWYKRYLSL